MNRLVEKAGRRATLLTLSETEKAYLAGIVDGEGGIAISKRKPNRTSGEVSPTYMNYVKIGSIDGPLCQWILDRTGVGTIYRETRWSRPQDRNRRPFYTWHVTNLQAEAFLRAVYPYLVIKKNQADVVFRLRATVMRNVVFRDGVPDDVIKERDECFQALAALHRRTIWLQSDFDLP